MIYVWDDIPSKMFTKHNLPEDIQAVIQDIPQMQVVIVRNISRTLPKS